MVSPWLVRSALLKVVAPLSVMKLSVRGQCLGVAHVLLVLQTVDLERREGGVDLE